MKNSIAFGRELCYIHLNMETSDSRMAKSVGVFSLATGVSRIFGMGREMVFAYLFGAGYSMDAFRLAYNIPNILRDLFAEGTLGASFVPVFAEYHERKGDKDAWNLANISLNALLLIVGGITLLGILFSPWIVKVVAHGFGKEPGKLGLTIQLTQLMFPFLLLICVAALVMAILNFFSRFFITGIAPVMFNVGIIGSSLLLFPVFKQAGIQPIFGVAVGVLIGGAAQLGFQIFPLLRQGYSYRPRLSLSHPGVRRVGKLAVPVILGLAATRVNVFINLFLAALLEQGSVSYLGYAFRLMVLPLGVFGVAVSTVALPRAAREAALEEQDKVRETLSLSLRLVFLLTIPASALLFVLASPIIRILYERGEFGPADTVATSQALMLYCIGIFAVASVKVLASIFYSLKDSRTPMKVSFLTVAVNLLFSLLLIGTMRFRALALAASIAAIFNFGLLLWLVRRRMGSIDGGRILKSGGKAAVSSLAMALGVFFFSAWLQRNFFPLGLTAQLVHLVLAIMLGLGIFLLFSYILRAEEVELALKRIMRR